jgi:hypothetical protein
MDSDVIEPLLDPPDVPLLLVEPCLAVVTCETTSPCASVTVVVIDPSALVVVVVVS